jgi:hypothetical protein
MATFRHWTSLAGESAAAIEALSGVCLFRKPLAQGEPAWRNCGLPIRELPGCEWPGFAVALRLDTFCARSSEHLAYLHSRHVDSGSGGDEQRCAVVLTAKGRIGSLHLAVALSPARSTSLQISSARPTTLSSSSTAQVRSCASCACDAAVYLDVPLSVRARSSRMCLI